MMTVVVLRGGMAFTSDQATVILMAQDIRHGRAFPIFYEGVLYAGTLEPLLLAASFLALPETLFTFRVVMALLTIATILVIWRSGVLAFGERPGFLGALALAAGPSFFFVRGLQSDGAYDSVLLLGALEVFLALLIDARASEGGAVRGWIALLAGIAGLAWWVLPLSVVFAVPVAIILLLGPARASLGHATVPVAAVAFVLGGVPWWVFNLQSRFASLVIPEMRTASGHAAVSKLPAFINQGLTEILGFRAPWSQRLPPLAGPLSALLLVVLVATGLRVFTAGMGSRRGRSALAFSSLLVATPAFALTAARSDFSDARYLLPLYVAGAPLLGLLLESVARPARWVLGAVLLAIPAYSHVTLRHDWNRELATTADLDPVIDRLRSEAIDAVYTPYWAAYKLTVLSGGTIVGTPFGPRGLTRREGDRKRVDLSVRPAFLLWGEEARRLASLQGFGTVRSESFQNGALFWDLSTELLGSLRSCSCVPTSAEQVPAATWIAYDVPNTVPAGSRIDVAVTVQNSGTGSWRPGTHLSYHWIRTNGVVEVRDGERSEPARLPEPGETIRAIFHVFANVPPGDYSLVIDAVEENVAWFADRGSPPVVVAVRVR